MTNYGNFTSSFEFDQAQEQSKNVIYGGRKKNDLLFEEKQFLHLFYSFVLSISFFIVTYSIRSKLITTTTYDSKVNKEKIDDTQMMLVCIYYLVMGFVALYCVHYFFAEPFENTIPWHLFIVVITWSACTLYDLNMAFSFLQNVVQENHQVLLELEKNQQITEQFQQQYQQQQYQQQAEQENNGDGGQLYSDQFHTTLDQVHLPENIAQKYQNHHVTSDQYSIPPSTSINHDPSQTQQNLQYNYHQSQPQQPQQPQQPHQQQQQQQQQSSSQFYSSHNHSSGNNTNHYNDFYSDNGIEALNI